jgi:hypothetical protein
MRQYRVLLPVLAIVFVSGALLTPAAFAAKEEVAPEYGRCIKVTAGSGEYSNAKCTTLGGTEKYKWEPFSSIAHRGFTVENKAGKSMTLETVTKLAIVCTGATGTGEYTGRRTVGAVAFRFTGCKDESTVAPCASAGQASGEIVTSMLAGKLGVETLAEAGATANSIGLELHSATGKTFAEFECGATKMVVTGSVIHPVDTNAMKDETTDEGFKASKGKQIPERFETAEAPIAELEMSVGGEERQAGLTLATVVRNEAEEKVEARSISEPECTGTCIYIAQTGKGSGSEKEAGTSCATAKPLSSLEGTLTPGDTYALCSGTFTSSHTAIETSGTAGHPITVEFLEGAEIAVAGSGCANVGCIEIHPGLYKGVIRNTALGFVKNEEQAPSTKGIKADGCKHCRIENLEIGPLFKTAKGDVVGNTAVVGVEIENHEGEPEYDEIKNDVFRELGWSIEYQNGEKDGHLYVEDDSFVGTTHGLYLGDKNPGSSPSIGEETFAHNRFYGNTNWEFSNSFTAYANHVDGFHCASGETVRAHYTGLYIYDNYLTTEGENANAPVYVEGSGAGTPCADATSNIWIFDNVLTGNSASTRGLAETFSGEVHAFSNTLIGEAPASALGKEQGCVEFTNETNPATIKAFKDNVITGCRWAITAYRANVAAKAMTNNLWANKAPQGSGAEPFTCVKKAAEESKYEVNSFGAWVMCMNEVTEVAPETESKYETSAEVNESTAEAKSPLGKPEGSSYAKSHGANLTSACETLAGAPETACKENILGEARPGSGAWTIGAY